MSEGATDIGELARRAIERCERLARYSEDPPRITRTFLSPPMRAVHHTVGQWMAEAEMTVRVDWMGNLIGRHAGTMADSPAILIGSHLDTVPNAGKFDGILGVMLGLAVVEAMRGRRPIGIDVLGFSEEEGVRFATPYLGSKAFVGQLDGSMLELRDANGVSVAEAVRAFGLDPFQRAAERANYVAYLEAHIEQGPVLESLNQPVGVVTAISGQSRRRVRFVGRAAHAGTTPMHLRQDALAAAAEWVGRVEAIAKGVAGGVATVGSLAVSPGASNVVAGEVNASLDVRHVDDAARIKMCEEMLASGSAIARSRGVAFDIAGSSEHSTVPMDAGLREALASAAGADVPMLASGAGHDAAIIAPVIPSCMLFVRSPGGVSHHPDESVLAGDVELALATMVRFVERLAGDYNSHPAQPRKD